MSWSRELPASPLAPGQPVPTATEPVADGPEGAAVFKEAEFGCWLQWTPVSVFILCLLSAIPASTTPIS